MAKSSTIRQERTQREDGPAPVRSAASQTVSVPLDRCTLTFNELKALLKTTDGNLSVHARKLEEADYILCTKSFDGRLPKTEYRLAPAGRKALERYLNHMEALIRATREK